MQRLVLVICTLTALAVSGAQAQDGYQVKGDIDVDFLFNYYQQDGEHSPVTGGIGSEDMDVVSPVVLVSWRADENWTLRSDLGVDSITSASVDAIDDDVSSASRQDSRAFLTLTGTRDLAGDQAISLSGGFSKEYDYSSLMVGAGWSKEFNQKTSSVSAQLRVYSDTVELYDIDGVVQGEDDRETYDLTLGFSQVLGPKTLFTSELYLSQQDGFLSTPFHEVILASGARIAERLPDSRQRTALGLGINHAISARVVPRVRYRFYDDDWGIRSHTVELEPHFRLSADSSTWWYPILRWHDQTSSEYFALPGTVTAADDFFTTDYDLSEFTAMKYGFGFSRSLQRGQRTGWLRRLRSIESRITWYERDDDFESLSASFGMGWRF